MAENTWPQTPRQQVAWLQQRISDWVSNADSIGLNDTQVGEMQTLLAQVGNNLNEAITARSIAKGKTQTFYTSAGPLVEMAGGFIKTIRAYAITTGDPVVYELARINAPATPSPAPPPTEPTEIRTTLENDGSILITWKAKNAAPGAGTAFNIYRKLAGQSGYSPVGTTGLRRFLDQTVPPGAASASYLIRGIRGDKVGDFSEPVTVYLGKVDLDGGEGLTLAA